jgi:hypothetical protein
MYKKVCIVLLSLFLSPAITVAAPDGWTLLPTAATDNQVYAARFAVGLTVDGGASWQTSATLNQLVLVKGSLDPAPVHVGSKADVFVIGWYDDELYMQTASGAWAWWSGDIADLKPARDDIVLAASQELTIYQGPLPLGGQPRLYMGYRPASGSGGMGSPNPGTIIYSATGAAFDVKTGTTDPQTWFATEIFDAIVMPRCTLCHVDGGVADSSALHFIRDASLARENFDIFEAFYRQQDDAYDYVLDKVSGGNGHAGGIQLPRGGTEYQKMAAFLGLLDGASTVPSPTGAELFGGVRHQSAVDTLRDAALLLAGRLPTAAESAAANAGGDVSLRPLLLQLMQGEHFHDFIKDGADDRLFLRGNEDANLADDCTTCFPALNAEYWRLRDAVDGSGAAGDLRALRDWVYQLFYGIVEAPLELIAYVVENDKPYAEILTADYDMLTPVTNAAFGGTAVFAGNASPVVFRPGRIEGYYLRDSALVAEGVVGAPLPRIVHPGNMRVAYPHVGVLNSKAFLSRYPSTATNRNRARARWTYYNFLAVDVEALAGRTTDPVALADTDNPTLNNPACAVCHSVLDPVAGTFQDYGDNGNYRAAFNGTDALDDLYKTTPGGPYRPGDTWYADMRTPGFEGVPAAASNTTRWLAERIVRDKRFATATVRFWWPAVMGAEVLKAPEVASDADYAARLSAYSAQQAELARLSDSFVQSGLVLKQLLADMILSPWYRTERLDSTNTNTGQGRARSVASLTGEKLLTPELLARKTQALTGFNWHAVMDTTTGAPVSGLESDYNTFYGGIDGSALKVRARTMTPLMSNVAAAHALESSCPIVLGDFIRPDSQRLLFGGLSPWVTPLTEASGTKMLTSTGSTDFQPESLTTSLQPGPKKIVVSLLNDACDYATNANQCTAGKNLIVGSITIKTPNGQTTMLSGDTAVRGSCAAATGGNSLTLHSSCTAEYAFTAATAGTYTVTASVAATHTAQDPVLAGMNIEADGSPLESNTVGATLLKHKLMDLHGKLLGQTLTLTSPELLAPYDLLLQTWQRRRAGPFTPSLLQGERACEWPHDIGFIDTLSYPGVALTDGRYNTAEIDAWLGPQAQDPLYMKQSWVVVMTYLLSHYDYLHE